MQLLVHAKGRFLPRLCKNRKTASAASGRLSDVLWTRSIPRSREDYLTRIRTGTTGTSQIPSPRIQ
jgi:hypothetical protein